MMLALFWRNTYAEIAHHPLSSRGPSAFNTESHNKWFLAIVSPSQFLILSLGCTPLQLRLLLCASSFRRSIVFVEREGSQGLSGGVGFSKGPETEETDVHCFF